MGKKRWHQLRPALILCLSVEFLSVEQTITFRKKLLGDTQAQELGKVTKDDKELARVKKELAAKNKLVEELRNVVRQHEKEASHFVEKGKKLCQTALDFQTASASFSKDFEGKTLQCVPLCFRGRWYVGQFFIQCSACCGKKK